MELRHLITFKTIVETGGFKKAADKLGYAQSSITTHIKGLEKELGQPLFDRLGKTITLTQAGHHFYPYALDIITLYDKSKQVLNEGETPWGDLTLGVSESLMIYWLPDLIKQFMERFPNVNIVLKSLNYEDLTAQLKQGEIEAAILVESPDWRPHTLTIKELKRDRLDLIYSPNISARALKTMLVTEYSCSWRPYVNTYLKQTNNDNMKKLELPSIEAIKQGVICGLGKAMLPKFVVEKEIESGEFIKEPVGKLNQEIAIMTAIHTDKWIGPNLQAFLSLLYDR
ncbi:LysR family transcriptional regulator [Salipaludibacillus sp. LMS25]|uniref:LysR family transcriptional regulator n=1 Tax=Salipaludibacillus sp. LMS25 TaxID=2924031 RepID=UPI0020D05C0E|nr:LysR family transcriptional regulator [Salipaludibacillus sp. LMS25]UTR13760.1 LysR family transcriptional regulator [Salipaludibacillus sp. LMS25]